MNNIKVRQDLPENLRLLAAQRVAYARAKKMFSIQIVCTVAFALIFNFIRLIPTEKIAIFLPYILTSSSVIAIADVLFFIKVISKMRTNAAKVQELFDCAVFGITWNSINSGATPDKNFVHENFKRYVKNHEKPIDNWYDIPLEGLSQEEAILLCQETNLWYDGNLREAFKKLSIKILLTMIGVSVLLGLITNIGFQLMVAYIVAPLIPAILLTLKIYQENEKSISAINELKSEVLALKKSTDIPTTAMLRQVQDKIFCSRKDSALVPDWFYVRKRGGLEEGMKVNASGY